MNKTKNSFTCYFCKEIIENDTEMGHTSVCGNVLMPCPNKCGSYISRQDFQFHKDECLNKVRRSTDTSPRESRFSFPSASSSLIRQPKSDIYQSLTNLQNQIQTISTNFNKFEQRNDGSLQHISKHQNHTETLRTQIQQKQEIEQLKQQYYGFLESCRALDLKINIIRNLYVNSKQEREVHWLNLQQKVSNLEKVQTDVDLVKQALYHEQNQNHQSNLELSHKLEEFTDISAQENATTAALWNDHKQQINEVLTEVTTIKKVIDEQKAKHATMVFDVKNVAHIATEAADNFEIQGREFGKLKKQMEQFKLDLEILENLACGDAGFGATSTAPGRVIWKITGVQEKMAKAKELDTVLRSQVFYTHDFGYRIRILVYLNGLKKWKDRYVLISLHVLRGEFDALLKWPCHIEGNVSLRDLENIENPSNFVKNISAKRWEGDEDSEEPQESSSSFIFIPHTTLIKEKYLKDDTIYLDVRIDQSRRPLAETFL